MAIQEIVEGALAFFSAGSYKNPIMGLKKKCLNVHVVSLAAFLGERCVTSKKTAARETNVHVAETQFLE